MNFSDFFPTTWVQAHAAVTHFPIALLLAAVALEAGGLLWKRAAWREIAFVVLGLAVVSLPFALLSGWLTGRAMARPPVGFDLHWKVALVATAFATAWWIWRWKTRPKYEIAAPEIIKPEIVARPAKAQWAMLGLAGLSAMSVGYTGHLGGDMVFGGREDETTVAVAPENPDENRMEKIALAAGKMENAAGKMDVATDRLALAAIAKNQKPAASKAAPEVKVVAAPPSEVKVDASALDRAAQNMERVATKFDNTAQKMEKIAQQMQTSSAPQTAAAPTKNVAPETKNPVIISKVVPTEAPAKAAFDPQLVALGAKLYQSEDLGCTGCHKMNGAGGRSGPDLTHAGALQPDIDWHIAHLKNPKSKVPGSKMPAYDDVPENDLRALGTYLASLK